MEFTLAEPLTGLPLHFDVKPENYHGEQGFRISYGTGSSFFISSKLGTWRVLDDHHVDPELLEKIGLAIEEGLSP